MQITLLWVIFIVIIIIIIVSLYMPYQKDRNLEKDIEENKV